MSDTPESISAIMRMRLGTLHGSERLRMGFAMFDAAKAMMVASIADLTAKEQRKTIFTRLYGNEFDSQAIKKIFDYLEQKTG